MSWCKPCTTFSRRYEPGWAVMLSGALALLTGCATPPPAKPSTVFYPPPPDTPRFQYLTSFSAPSDVLTPPSPIMRFLFGPAPQPSGIVKPYGLALKNGRLYVSDSYTATIHVADLRRHTWEYFRPTGSGRLRKSIGLAVDDNDNLYVGDTARGQVVIFDAKGTCVGHLGTSGELKPTALEIAGSRLYVADLNKCRVLVYDTATREVVGTFPRVDVTNETEVLYQPMGLAIAANGTVFVSDMARFHIQVYNPDGTYLRTLGRHGDGPGEFVRNKGLAMDRERRLFAVDAEVQIVQLFDDQDRLLMYFGDPDSGEDGRMRLPADILVDYDHVDLFRKYVAPGFDIDYIVLVSNQLGDRKVNVYGFLHPPSTAEQGPANHGQTVSP